MKARKISVALLTYNRSAYLKESLEAVLGQTFGDFELIVLDNHSTDDTRELVMGFKDRRLTYLRQPAGLNPAENHLTGEWVSRGEFVIVTHDDDIMEPTMLERQMAFFKAHPHALVCATNVSLIDRNGDLIQDRLYRMHGDRIFPIGEYIRAYLEEKLWLPASTYLFRRRLLFPGGGKKPLALYRGRYPANDDILRMIQFNAKGTLCLLADPLLRYRQHAGQECKNMDQSAPLLATFNELVILEKKNRQLHRHRDAIHGLRARYRAQHLLLRHSTTASRPRLLRELADLSDAWTTAIPQTHRIQDAAFPFEILLRLLDMPPTLTAKQVQQLRPAALEDGPSRGYRDWLQTLAAGRSLFSGHAAVRRIAVLGSLLATYLIVLDAQRSGVEVRCCLDSSPARQGNEIFGIPVVPHAELRRQESDIDAVVLSNEIGNTEGMRRILSEHLSDPAFPIVSWKDLARAANRPKAAKRR
jgi:glycosyltransferase involved in cell wall biosynthesis